MVVNSGAEKEYIDYLDRSRRTNKKSRLEIHEKLLSKETAKMYGLSDQEYDELTERLKQELEENKNNQRNEE